MSLFKHIQRIFFNINDYFKSSRILIFIKSLPINAIQLIDFLRKDYCCYVIITARQRSYGKGMFLVVVSARQTVILSTGRGPRTGPCHQDMFKHIKFESHCTAP